MASTAATSHQERPDVQYTLICSSPSCMDQLHCVTPALRSALSQRCMVSAEAELLGMPSSSPLPSRSTPSTVASGRYLPTLWISESPAGMVF